MRTTPVLVLSLALVAPSAAAVRYRDSAARLAQASQTARPARAAPASTRPVAAAPATAAPAPAAPAATTPPPTTAGAALTAEQVVVQVQAFYDRTTDFDAEFVQVSRNRLTGTEQRRTGHVRFLKPGRMRWDYATPPDDVIVSDGTTLWAYEAAAHQAIQSQMSTSQLPSALSFLTGTGRLATDFTYRLLDANRYRYPNGHVLELRPITPNANFERILFYVEPSHFQVARTVVIDAQGNQNRFDFANPRVNMNPPQSTFVWAPPAGTQVVRP